MKLFNLYGVVLFTLLFVDVILMATTKWSELSVQTVLDGESFSVRKFRDGDVVCYVGTHTEGGVRGVDALSCFKDAAEANRIRPDVTPERERR